MLNKRHGSVLKKLPSNNIDKKSFGGKSYGLNESIKFGFNTPITYSLGIEAFNSFLEHNELLSKLNTVYQLLQDDEVEIATSCATKLIMEILQGELPESIKNDISLISMELEGKNLAIRSSAINEDGEIHSWAGQFDSFLNINPTNIEENLKKCWASSLSECSGQLKLVTVLEFSQYNLSDLLGVRPPLY